MTRALVGEAEAKNLERSMISAVQGMDVRMQVLSYTLSFFPITALHYRFFFLAPFAASSSNPAASIADRAAYIQYQLIDIFFRFLLTALICLNRSAPLSAQNKRYQQQS